MIGISNKKDIVNIMMYVVLSACLFSCSQNTPSPTSNQPIANWDFEININGITSKAAGTSVYPDNFENHAYAPNAGDVYLKVSDQSDDSYISGENCHIWLSNSNLSLGTNTFNILMINLGDTTIPLGMSSVPGVQPSSGFNRININITSLGTPTTGQSPHHPSVYGSNIEGNSSGTLYLRDLNTAQLLNGVIHYDYNTPVGTYSIDFSAFRLY